MSGFVALAALLAAGPLAQSPSATGLVPSDVAITSTSPVRNRLGVRGTRSSA